MKLFLVNVKCKRNEACPTYVDTFVYGAEDGSKLASEINKESYPARGILFYKELSESEYEAVRRGTFIYRLDPSVYQGVE